MKVWKFFPAERVVITGNLVCKDWKLENVKKLYLSSDFSRKETILVVGGSRARTINISKGLDKLFASGVQSSGKPDATIRKT